MIRAFIAVALPESLRNEVAMLSAHLRSSEADVKWVAAGNLHLTLKFLGDIEENQVGPIEEALSAAVKSHSLFTIQLEGIGAFPRTTSPRVVWIGVGTGKEQLTQLAQCVEKTCIGLGFPEEERAFSPHLTIGRVRSRDRLAQLIKRLQVVEFCGKNPAQIDRLILFQSYLSPQGPTYTPLAEIPLG